MSRSFNNRKKSAKLSKKRAKKKRRTQKEEQKRRGEDKICKLSQAKHINSHFAKAAARSRKVFS
jgi:hypothetical protein